MCCIQQRYRGHEIVRTLTGLRKIVTCAPCRHLGVIYIRHSTSHLRIRRIILYSDSVIVEIRVLVVVLILEILVERIVRTDELQILGESLISQSHPVTDDGFDRPGPWR